MSNGQFQSKKELISALTDEANNITFHETLANITVRVYGGTAVAAYTETYDALSSGKRVTKKHHHNRYFCENRTPVETCSRAQLLCRISVMAAVILCMKTIIVLALALQLSAVALAQTVSSSAPPAAPQIADVPSGELHLKGYFWKPAGPGPFPAILFNHGSGADDPQHTAGRTMAEAASDLAPIFLKHGYALFYLCRRGQGLSADQGPFMQDLLKQAEAKGADARKQLHYQLVTGSQLDDALAGLTFLKAAPDVDPKRIAIVGHSFGGMLTLLSGDHDSSIRAEVAFAAGANSWRASQELRDRTLAAVGKTTAHVMLVYAANDYDTTPGKDISAELGRLHKSHLLKIYPVIGKSSDDGHSLLYLGISEWEPDVFQFLDDNVKR